MTLDEAIINEEEAAEKYEKMASWFWGKEGYEDCIECAEEYRQLAEWLKELKTYRAREQKAIRNRCPMV